MPLPYAYSSIVEFEYTTSAVLVLTAIFLSLFQVRIVGGLFEFLKDE